MSFKGTIKIIPDLSTNHILLIQTFILQILRNPQPLNLFALKNNIISITLDILQTQHSINISSTIIRHELQNLASQLPTDTIQQTQWLQLLT